MQIAITDFKARCTEYIRNLADSDQPIEITKRGRVVAILSYPEKDKKKNPLFGAMKGAVTHIADDFDEPDAET